MPDLDDMRIPVKYLANLLTGGKEDPIRFGLKRMMAMRHYMRNKMIEGKPDTTILDEVELTTDLVEDMYKIMAIANYEDRYVIPTGHREETLDAYGESGGCGFSFGNGCSSHSNSAIDLFEHPKQTRGQSASTKDNRVNTIFERDYYENISAVKSGCGSHSAPKQTSGGCGGGSCGGGCG
jgi:nitrate reductase beta subunit